MAGNLDLKGLKDMVRDEQIDTVLVVFVDMQGRFMGKRVTGHFFLDEMVDGDAMHGCNYLLTVDVDMEPLPGYEYANWEKGYGDFRCIPDMSTLRHIPWLENTALVICDVYDEESDDEVDVSPRQILKRQIDRAQEAGLTVKCGSELEFFLFRDSYEEAAAKGYRDLTPHSHYIEDYHIFQTTKDEYLIRQIRNGMDGAGVPVEFSKGEWGRGQHEINLAYSEALEMADRHVIYKNGVKEIAALNERAITFMAKPSMDEAGSSFHLHSSLWDASGSQCLTFDESAPNRMSTKLRHFLGGLIGTGREFAWMFAPYINSYKRYQPQSWAPTALAWAYDNRTCGFRIIGHGKSLRVESRIPGADANPYLAFAATIAAGLHGIENEFEPPDMYRGNAYEATDVERVPWNITEAITELENSELATEAFGEDVHKHLINTAKQEWARSNQTVTDWELQRNFERI